jgi:hypothetical protein
MFIGLIYFDLTPKKSPGPTADSAFIAAHAPRSPVAEFEALECKCGRVVLFIDFQSHV